MCLEPRGIAFADARGSFIAAVLRQDRGAAALPVSNKPGVRDARLAVHGRTTVTTTSDGDDGGDTTRQ